jgi:hypothetical protein
MDPEPLNRWGATSPLLQARQQAERAFDAAPRRPVSPEQARALEARGNTAEDWSAVLVPGDFDTANVQACRFEGRVELGRFVPGGGPEGHGPLSLDRPGLYGALLRDCRIADGARVAACGLVERVFIGPGALVESVARLAMAGPAAAFGNRLALFDAPLYARKLRATAELPFHWAVRATGPGADGPRDAAFEAALHAAADAWADRFESTSAYVGAGARVRATPLIENCWIGANVEVDGAGTLRDSTLWAAPDAPTRVADGAQLRGALVGPGCRLLDQCLVRDSLLIEAVDVGDQAIVKGSLIGPNVRLGECEINDGLIGPFTTALHHSLVIAAWWPEGRGNVGYGANVGSNHTGRAPDQEIWPGEGVFFGLGCNIKLPSNFREAPYSLIATGTDTLPQKFRFPFALIAKPAILPPDLPRALTEARPGWGLIHNAYGLERQERNQAARNRARRTPLAPGVFRLDGIPLLEDARARLVEAGGDVDGIYTEREIPGLGANFMTEEARRQGVEAYAFGLSLIASRCLLRRLEAASVAGEADAAARASIDRAVDAAARILGNTEPESLLLAALSIEGDWSRRVAASKARDDDRGARTIDDYAERHVAADDDPLIADLRETLNRHRERLPRYVSLIGRSRIPASGART